MLPDKHILFIGDSHIEVSVNDNLNNHFFTFAQSGDNYLYTYIKLKKFLKDNPQFDTIYLGIDYHNIDKTADEWYSNQSYLDYKLPLCFPYISSTELQTLFSINPIGFIKSVPYLFSIPETEGKTRLIKKYGSFLPVDSTISKTKINEKYISNYNNMVSEVQLLYLGKIKEYCDLKSKKLILITTPIHHSVQRNEILENIIDHYIKINDIDYLNFRELNISDDFYADRFHLNQKGSIYFTNYLDKYIIN